MKERYKYLLIILNLVYSGAFAQVPVIQKVEPLISFPKSRVLISGSGFGAPANLQVWFDHVQATIITSTDFSIEVEVPPQARLDHITVFNKTSKLLGESKLKFMPFFNGEGFDPAKLEAKSEAFDYIYDIISLDVDGDNKPDLIGSKKEDNATTMALMMNQSTPGNINFVNTTIPALNLNAPTGYLATGDLNLDGKPDLVATRFGTTSNIVFVLTNTSTVGNPNFAAPLMLTLDIAQGVREVGVADMNGDGKPEIVVANSDISNNDIYIYINESTGGTLKINPTPVKIAVTGSTKSWALDLQDMDGDGKTDIITTKSQSESDIFVLKNTSTAGSISFSSVTKISLPGGYNDLATADFNKDGKLDIITTGLFTNSAVVLLNKSTASGIQFDSPISVGTDAQPFGIDVGDLNGDRFPDFIVPSQGSKSINVFLHNGNTASPGFNKVAIPTTNNNWFARAGDLDGDGKPDIAFTSRSVSGTGGFFIEILRNKNCHKPEILNQLPLTICPAQTIRLTTYPMPGLTYNWSNGFSSIKNTAEPFVDITAAASYTVTATSSIDGCAVTSAPITVTSGAGTLPADPTIYPANSQFCTGSTIALSTDPVSGATYSWTGPNNFTANTQSISIPSATIAHAGIYSLTIKSGDCSSKTTSKRVDVVDLGSFTIASSSPSNTICAGQPLTLRVTSATGYTYQWKKDGNNINGATSTSLAVTSEGSYTVNVTSSSLSCSQETSAVNVTIYTAPSASFQVAATGCIDNVITFTNNSVTDARITNVVYAWQFGDNSTSDQISPTHTYTTAQSYAPALTVTYPNVTGCSSSTFKNINIIAGTVPVITATANELCASGSEKSTLSVDGTFTSFLWSTNATSSFIEVTTPDTYSVTTTDANNCEGTTSIVLAEKTSGCSPADSDIEFPAVFTPNGDSQNDFWLIPDAQNKQECTMSIFDGRGRRIYQKKGFPVGGWDGRSDEGGIVPDGTYYFVFNCPDTQPATGSVLIVR